MVSFLSHRPPLGGGRNDSSSRSRGKGDFPTWNSLRLEGQSVLIVWHWGAGLHRGLKVPPARVFIATVYLIIDRRPLLIPFWADGRSSKDWRTHFYPDWDDAGRTANSYGLPCMLTHLPPTHFESQTRSDAYGRCCCPAR